MKTAKTKKPNARFFTVGHSNHSAADFIELLTAQRLKLLIDVRKIPKSRRNPQFHAGRLALSLKRKGIQYIYLPGLGGRRPVKKDSINTGWRNASFRAYADHMLSDEFKRDFKRLLSLSKRKRLAYMCSEAVPWRCHRRLISDALVTKGHAVLDIYTKTSVKPHRLTPFARKKRDGSLYYPE